MNFVTCSKNSIQRGISRVELNDIMWFDSDWIFETLGISEEEEEEEEESTGEIIAEGY